jgi:hypothetical protein
MAKTPQKNPIAAAKDRATFLEETIAVAIFALYKKLEREAKTHGAEEDWKGVWRKITSDVAGKRVTYDRQAVFQHENLIWRGTGQIPQSFVDLLKEKKVKWADIAVTPERAPKLWCEQVDGKSIRTYGWNGERSVPEWAWDAYSKGDVEALKAMIIPGAPITAKELLAKHLPLKKKFWAPSPEKLREMEVRRLIREAEAAKPKRGPGRPRKNEAAPTKAKRRT